MSATRRSGAGWPTRGGYRLAMDSVVADGDGFVLRLSRDEVIVLYEALGRADFADELECLELRPGAERTVMTDLMLALRPGAPDLGTDGYGPALRAAEARLAENG